MDDDIKSIHKEGGDKTEEEGPKGEGGGNDDGTGEGEEMDRAASLEASSDDDKIYCAIASGQGTTTTKAKDNAKDDDDVEGLMVGTPQFWVCAMGHMEAVAQLITERGIDCLEHLTNFTCRYFEDGKGLELRFNFDINNNKYYTDELLIKRYEVPNILLDDEPILKNVTGCNIHWKEGSSLTYRDVNKKQKSKIGRRAIQIRKVNNMERTNSFFHFFR